MLADRHGPRFFMGVGPLITAAGLALFMRLDENVDYVTDLLPALLVFGLGLSMTVAPLTATVLADADEHNAGVASGVNNAIARVAGLVAIASVGAVVAASYGSSLEEKLGPLAGRPGAVGGAGRRQARAAGARSRPRAAGGRPAPRRAGGDRRLGQVLPGSVWASRRCWWPSAGSCGLIGIQNPRRRVEAADCPGGQLVGVPEEGARGSPCDWGRPERREPRPGMSLRRRELLLGAGVGGHGRPGRRAGRRRPLAPGAERAARRGPGSRAGARNARLRRRAPGVQRALRRHAAACGGGAARHPRRPGRGALGRPLRRPARAALRRAQLRRLLDHLAAAWWWTSGACAACGWAAGARRWGRARS